MFLCWATGKHRKQNNSKGYPYNNKDVNETVMIAVHTLNLTVPRKGYVVGIYSLNDTASQIYTFMYATEKTDNGASRIYFMVPEGDAGNVFVVNHRNKVVASQNLTSGNFVDIRPGFVDNGEYMLYYGKDCEGTACPKKIPFTVSFPCASLSPENKRIAGCGYNLG
ncbi:hypothetical protein OESDEN_10103 [Oesophagostomum dentatum]|uniref:Uncharacterized protein n=1 Tax=Oesophagostomum dentatum TaxID=61180 RepID=A0A0B1T3V2_OESDE|nr:hypothetical protein OESDEN_10103 [Oesophagostomum dentatum]